MKSKAHFFTDHWLDIFVVASIGALLVLTAGCGTGSDVSFTGGSAADQAAVMEAVRTEPFFTDSVTDTDEDSEAAAGADFGVIGDTLSASPLATGTGTAELPRFWWRGDLERLGREIDIHIDDDVALVSVTHEIAGTFFMADQEGDHLVLWGKPFEDLVQRSAEFRKGPWGWQLTAISPVEFSLADRNLQSVSIEGVRAYVGDDLVWEATDPAVLCSVPAGLPVFSHGEEVRVEAGISNASEAQWQPPEFVFLHRPGPSLAGRRTRDPMFDDGTNGDLVAGDGVYTRMYTIGPRRGRHFAAVDVIDSSTFMELDAPYNSTAWGMPYIVE